MSVRRSVILGCGAYLPEKVITNDDLAKTIDTVLAGIAIWTGDVHGCKQMPEV